MNKMRMFLVVGVAIGWSRACWAPGRPRRPILSHEWGDRCDDH